MWKKIVPLGVAFAIVWIAIGYAVGKSTNNGNDRELSRTWALAEGIFNPPPFAHEDEVEDYWNQPITRNQLAQVLYREVNPVSKVNVTDTSMPTGSEGLTVPTRPTDKIGPPPSSSTTTTSTTAPTVWQGPEPVWTEPDSNCLLTVREELWPGTDTVNHQFPRSANACTKSEFIEALHQVADEFVRERVAQSGADNFAWPEKCMFVRHLARKDTVVNNWMQAADRSCIN